jgi:hypothetical protein
VEVYFTKKGVLICGKIGGRLVEGIREINEGIIRSQWRGVKILC